jgi:phage terminase large subunit-like protein
MYQHAAGFVKRSENLQQLISVRDGYRELRSKSDGGTVKVLASDSNTADGIAPTLFLCDELHRHKSPDLYAIARDGLGKRDKGQMVTISTAGADLESPLGKLRERAHLLEDREQTGFHIRSRSPDGSFVAHMWEVPEGQDCDDMEIVKKANPSSFVTIEDLSRRHQSPSMHKHEWLRYACNQWVSTLDNSWIEVGKWAALADYDLYIPEHSKIWVGVDIGLRHDTSAVAVVHEMEDGRWAVEAEIFEPPEGGEVDLALIENYIMSLHDRFEVQGVVYDRWAFSRSAQELEARGAVCIEFPMTNARTVPACSRLLEAVNRGELVHNGDPKLEAHINAGTVKMTERGWRIAKAPRGTLGRGKIDALIALLLAFTVGTDQSLNPASIYETEDLIVL